MNELIIVFERMGKEQDSKRVKDISNCIIIKTKEDLFLYLKDNPEQKIYVDAPKGTKKGFGGRKKELPFDYGEISKLVNPADDMGWDVIIPPSVKEVINIIPIGYVQVKDDKKIWKEKADRKPPVGNDKIIISNDGKISKEDKKIIEAFFQDMWQFEKIKWI